MSIMSATQTFSRHAALRVLVAAGGICTTRNLDENIRDLFGLPSSDPNEFVQNLVFIKEHTSAASDAIEAAFNALNIGASMMMGDLSDRRLALLEKRHKEGRSLQPFETIHTLEDLENRGFSFIANSYDMAMKLKRHQEFAESICTLAADTFMPVNLRRTLHLELAKLNEALN